MPTPNKRSRKRAAQAEARAEAGERFRYGLLAVETLRTLDLQNMDLQVVDAEVFPSLDGSPEGMSGWLIFPDRAQAKTAARPTAAAQIVSRLRQALVAKGFPQHAVPSFELKFTSLPEIDKAGGRFAFFRG